MTHVFLELHLNDSGSSHTEFRIQALLCCETDESEGEKAALSMPDKSSCRCDFQNSSSKKKKKHFIEIVFFIFYLIRHALRWRHFNQSLTDVLN